MRLEFEMGRLWRRDIRMSGFAPRPRGNRGQSVDVARGPFSEAYRSHGPAEFRIISTPRRTVVDGTTDGDALAAITVQNGVAWGADRLSAIAPISRGNRGQPSDVACDSYSGDNRGCESAECMIISGPRRRLVNGATDGEALAAIRVRNVSTGESTDFPRFPTIARKSWTINQSPAQATPFRKLIADEGPPNLV